MDTIHIAATVDKNFIQHLGVMLCSLFENNKGSRFVVHLITDVDSHDDFIKLQKLIASYGHELRVIHTDGKKVNGLKVIDHFTQAIYYRLFLPDFVDESVSKVLYLDSDIIVKKDISPLWHTDLSGYSHAAVQDPLFNRYKQLDFPLESIYFNSGVLLINLVYWRKNKVGEKVIDYVAAHAEKIAYGDQDGLNVILQGKWLELPPIWNQQTLFFEEEMIKNKKIRKDWIDACKSDPAIIHYTGRFKPWQYYCEHPFRKEYHHYRSLTEWRNVRLNNGKFAHLSKQYAKQLLNFIYGREKYKIHLSKTRTH